MRAARAQSSARRTSAQPRSTARRASATSPRHSANEAAARVAGTSSCGSGAWSISSGRQPSRLAARSSTLVSTSSIAAVTDASAKATASGLHSSAVRIVSRASCPAAGVEQRLGDVAAQRVAVGDLEPVGAGALDRLAGDLDRLVAPAEQRQRGREVERRAEGDVRVVELAREPQRLLQLRDALARRRRPRPWRRRRCTARGPRSDRAVVADRAGDLDRLLADPRRLDEVAEEHQRLGERGEDRGAQVATARSGTIDAARRCSASARSWSPRARDTRPSIS